MKLNRVSFEIDGVLVHGFSYKTKADLWIHVQNRTFRQSLNKGSRFQKHSAHDSAEIDGILKAPMPGKVIKIAVADGIQVVPGQTLIVMEAMKMEYSLKAPFAGKVKLRNKKAGDQVVLGEVLAEVIKNES